MKSGAQITAQRAAEFGLTPQREGESDSEFKDRISGSLRAMGQVIEAHEAYNNALYDDPEDGLPMTGIIGATARAVQGRDYGARTGSRQVGDDIAAGTVAQAPKDDDDGQMALMAILLGLR